MHFPGVIILALQLILWMIYCPIVTSQAVSISMSGQPVEGESFSLVCGSLNCFGVPAFIHYSANETQVTSGCTPTSPSYDFNVTCNVCVGFPTECNITFMEANKTIHDGNWICRCLAVLSSPVNVNISVDPIHIETPDSVVTFTQGEKLIIWCQSCYYPSVVINWNASVILSEENTFGTCPLRNDILSSNSTIEVSDPGYYSCHFTNPHSFRTYSAVMEVIIMDATTTAQSILASTSQADLQESALGVWEIIGITIGVLLIVGLIIGLILLYKGRSVNGDSQASDNVDDVQIRKQTNEHNELTFCPTTAPEKNGSQNGHLFPRNEEMIKKESISVGREDNGRSPVVDNSVKGGQLREKGNEQNSMTSSPRPAAEAHNAPGPSGTHLYQTVDNLNQEEEESYPERDYDESTKTKYQF